MKSKTTLTLLLVLTLLGCSVAGFVTLRGAVARKMSVVAAQRAQEDRVMGLEFGNRLRNNLQELAQKEEVIKRTFIDGVHLVDFIESIEGFAAERNLKIEMDSVEQGEPKTLSTSRGKLVPVTFSIRTEGDYEDVSSFVRELVNFNERLDIEQLGMFSSGNGVYTLRLTVKGMMLSYE